MTTQSPILPSPPAARADTAAQSTQSKKRIQKLQRAIIDGLENVKAQEIVVFNTEHLSSLFERVIIASGSSSRQTRALSVGVVEALSKAGFPKPRIEGQSNGEWIIVDCGQAVVHVMQPSYRAYYNLEELWGDKPVRLKFGAAKPEQAPSDVAARPKRSTSLATPSLRRSSAAKKGLQEAFPSKAQLQKEALKKTTAKAATAGTSKTTGAKPVAGAKVKTVVVKPQAKSTGKRITNKVVRQPAPVKKTVKPIRKA